MDLISPKINISLLFGISFLKEIWSTKFRRFGVRWAPFTLNRQIFHYYLIILSKELLPLANPLQE